MKTFVMAVLLAGTPALAHDEPQHKPSSHAKKGHHEDAPRSFAQKPAVGTWARCAVSGDVFRVGPETQVAEYKGRWYPFCCEDCKPDFDANPAKYAK